MKIGVKEKYLRQLGVLLKRKKVLDVKNIELLIKELKVDDIKNVLPAEMVELIIEDKKRFNHAFLPEGKQYVPAW